MLYIEEKVKEMDDSNIIKTFSFSIYSDVIKWRGCSLQVTTQIPFHN